MKKSSEVKICKYCLRPYAANRSFQKYCSSECQDWDARRRNFIEWKKSGKWGLDNTTWEEYLRESVIRANELRESAARLREKYHLGFKK